MSLTVEFVALMAAKVEMKRQAVLKEQGLGSWGAGMSSAYRAPMSARESAASLPAMPV